VTPQGAPEGARGGTEPGDTGGKGGTATRGARGKGGAAPGDAGGAQRTADLRQDGRGAWLLLAVVSFAVFLAALDQTAVSALLPVIVKDFEGFFSPDAVERASWIITAYLVGYTVVMPVMGRVSDLFGHRRVFNISVLIFVIGSVLCALTGGFGQLAAARALQAVGGGAIVPIAMGMVGYTFGFRRQAFAIGILVAAGEAGGVLGPLYGAWLAEPFGWQFIFWVNVPLGLLVMGAVWLTAARWPVRRVPVDWRGALLLALFLAVVTMGLSGQRAAGWYNFVIPMLAAGTVLLAAFIWVERRQEHPAIRLSLFRNITFSAANLANLLEGVAMITALVQVPFFAYATREATPIEGGLLLIRMTLLIPVGAVIGGLLVNRVGHRFVAAAGFAFAAAGLFLVSRWPLDVSTAVETRDLALAGFGFGLNSPALAAAVVGTVERARLAAGSAIHIVFKMTGMMLGLAFLGGWGIYQFESLLTLEGLPLQDWDKLTAFVEQRSLEAILGVLNDFFLLASIVCALAIIPSLLINLRRDTPGDVP